MESQHWVMAKYRNWYLLITGLLTGGVIYLSVMPISRKYLERNLGYEYILSNLAVDTFILILYGIFFYFKNSPLYIKKPLGQIFAVPTACLIGGHMSAGFIGLGLLWGWF